jgi:glycyl-tRNA synthetase beta chain
LLDRLQAVDRFMASPQAPALCAAHKRIGNILKKTEWANRGGLAEIDSRRLEEEEEKALAEALSRLGPQAYALAEKGAYVEAMQGLAALKDPVDAFFDQVMVNAEDPTLRENRLRLLHNLFGTMNLVADLSRLAKA